MKLGYYDTNRIFSYIHLLENNLMLLAIVMCNYHADTPNKHKDAKDEGTTGHNDRDKHHRIPCNAR